MIVKGINILKLRAKDADFQLQPSKWDGPSHFNTSEFRCNHCGELMIHYDLVLALERLRSEIGKPLIITSGYRCIEKNKATKGSAKRSGHTKGYAADIALPSGFTMKLFRETIWRTRKHTGIKRVGSYDGYQDKHNFCHVGIRRKWIGRNSLAQRWGDW